MAIVFLHPDTGDDANNGQTPAAAIKTMGRAAEILGYGVVDGAYQVNTPDLLIELNDSIYLLGGVTVSLPFYFPMRAPTEWSQHQFRQFAIHGSADALLIIDGAGKAAFTVSAAALKINNIHYVRGYLTLSGLRIALTSTTTRLVSTHLQNSIVNVSPPSEPGDDALEADAAKPAITIANCVVRQTNPVISELVAPINPSGWARCFMAVHANVTANAPMTYVMESDPFWTSLVFRSASFNNCENASLTALGDYTWLQSMAALRAGRGAFLPQPAGSYPETDHRFWNFLYIPANHVENFTTWLQDIPTTAEYPGTSPGELTLNQGAITLINAGVDIGRVRSPVYVYTAPIRFHVAEVTASETPGTPGNQDGAYVDHSLGDVARTIELRASNTPFDPTDNTLPWTTFQRGATNPPLEGRYVQYRLTLSNKALTA